MLFLAEVEADYKPFRWQKNAACAAASAGGD
jgi:hypothetical protein